MVYCRRHRDAAPGGATPTPAGLVVRRGARARPFLASTAGSCPTGLLARAPSAFPACLPHGGEPGLPYAITETSTRAKRPACLAPLSGTPTAAPVVLKVLDSAAQPPEGPRAAQARVRDRQGSSTPRPSSSRSPSRRTEGCRPSSWRTSAGSRSIACSARRWRCERLPPARDPHRGGGRGRSTSGASSTRTSKPAEHPRQPRRPARSRSPTSASRPASPASSRPRRPPRLIEGSLPYLSPEQTGRTNRAIDSRTDLYSLGVTFYQMLTGRLPFEAQRSRWSGSTVTSPAPAVALGARPRGARGRSRASS